MTVEGNQFEVLPRDILELLLTFVDIPSIAALCQTSRPQHRNIPELASTEQTWLRLVNNRFNLFSAGRISNPRPNLYGGSTWKEAYRNMARCNRIPKMKVNFKKKNIFAKGGGYRPDTGMQAAAFDSNANANANANAKDASMKVKVKVPKKKSQPHHSQQFVACWVMINHTEDCNLRTTSMDIISSSSSSSMACHESISTTTNQVLNGANTRTSSRNDHCFIELQLAFQNSKSGFCKVDLDVCKGTVQMYDSTGDFLTQRLVRHGPLRPKVIYRSIGGTIVSSSESTCSQNQNQCQHQHQHQHQYLDGDFGDVLSLGPLEFVIVSVNVPLVHYRERNEILRFETDFLSRALSICVPVACQMSETSMENDGTVHSELVKKHSIAVHSSVVVATFANEHEIWENYMELPGGCLILVDKRD